MTNSPHSTGRRLLQHPAAYPAAPPAEQPDDTPEAPRRAVLPGERTLAALIEDLSRPLPERLVQFKPRRNRRTGQEVQLAYLNWRTVQRMLDYKAPGWSGRVTHITLSPERCAVSYELTIPTSDCGAVTRAATGTDDEDDEGYGDPVTNAEQQAFKRAAARFGLGLYLYDRK